MTGLSNDASLIQNIYLSRPFKVRNADEFGLESILDLFVDPTEGLDTPFEYENRIIKGRMGSGKTMYLRANHAYYLYTLVPSLLEGIPPILPIYIRLSDFQQINDPNEIYKAFIIKMITEISNIYLHLKDANKLAKIHNGILTLPSNIFRIDSRVSELYTKLRKLTAQEYVEKFSNSVDVSGNIKPRIFDFSLKINKENITEIKNKDNPSITDVENAYEKLLKELGGSLLVLIDEAGSINKSFFKEGDSTSVFENLMNQLRTTSFIRTKIAIYPQTYSDILTETRYGDAVLLEDDLSNAEGHSAFKKRAIALISRYLSKVANTNVDEELIFDNSSTNEKSDATEQLINASTGNMRRFVHLLDISMNEAYKSNNGNDKVNISHVNSALRVQANSMESQFNAIEKDYLSLLVNTCKNRGTYRFQFPNKAPVLMKYTNKSTEYNLLNIIENGTGRKGTTYSFDYAYCVFKEIPTHYQKDSERIDKTRSLKTGDWIKKVAQISEELLVHASLPGKIEGTVNYLNNENAFVKGEDEKQYFFTRNDVIKADAKKKLVFGCRLRFYPYISGENFWAMDVEIL